MGVDRPNYTQIPNLLLDDLMPYMGEAELKVTLALSRRTFGFHRDKVEISLSDLERATSLSRQGVINGVNAGIERGTIARSKGKRGGFVYEIIINDECLTSQRSRPVNEVDQSTSQPNRLALVNEVDQSSQRSRPPLVNEVDQNTPTLKKVLKKDRKKDLKKEAAPPATPKQPTAQQEMFGAVCEAVGWDYRIITDRNKAQVGQTIGILTKNGYTVEDVRRFMVEIWFHDYRWTDRASYPTLSQLRQEIGKLRSVVPDAAPPRQSKGMNSFNRLAANIGVTK